MGQILKDDLLEEYFRPLEERTFKKPFFYRFSGYDDAFISFLGHYLYEAEKTGIYIKDTLANPTNEDVNFFAQTVGGGFDFDREGRHYIVKKWFSQLNSLQQNYIFEGVEQAMVQLSQGTLSEDVLQNTFVKLLCWIKFYFAELLFALPFYGTPKILYQGTLGKYQLALLKLFNGLGCDVAVIDFLGKSVCGFTMSDYFTIETVELAQKGRPIVDFTEIDWEVQIEENAFKKKIDESENAVVTNLWAGPEDILENIFKSGENRGLVNNKIYTLFCEYRGVSDKEVYDSTLYQFSLELDKYKKPYILTERKIENPSVDEIALYQNIDRTNIHRFMKTLTDKFDFYKSESFNILGQAALYKTLDSVGSQNNISKLYNVGVTMLCWLNRYRDALFKYDGRGHLPLFLFYGNLQSKNEHVFMDLLSRLPVDILIFCPDKEAKNAVKSERVSRLEFEESMPITEFPRSEGRIVAGTAAYRAERELDTILYSDTGMYKAKQFKSSRTVNLKTTYDEIDILWHEPAKFRPYFSTDEEGAVIPNILAKISGVKGSKQEYVENIRKKITKDTIVIKGVPHFKNTDINPIKPFVPKLIKNKMLQIDEIKQHKEYKYDYLSEEIQDLILEKIQALIDENIIDGKTGGIEYAIGGVLLNLDKDTLRNIQRFDFTGNIPKLILIDTDEDMCSLEDCIYVMFLSLVGFDVLIYSPPGYRVIDKYLKNNIIKEHIIGEYVFDMELPKLEEQQQETKSFIERIFGKGKM